ncbi:MAG: hypothetical protein ABI947_19880 [Chloroflexota bacterium]
MKQRLVTALLGISLVALLLLFSSTTLVRSAQPVKVRLQATQPSELPPDTPVLDFDKPIVENLSMDTPGRLYKFTGKANQSIQITLKPKSGNMFVTMTVLDTDLQTTLGGTQGENSLGGSSIIQIPEDGIYVISIDYADSITGTPAPGSYELLLSNYKPQ